MSVVKKRLDALGLGDFCLELHSNKTNKAEVLQKLTATLALAGAQENVSLSEKSASVAQLKKDLAEPSAALHKKRRLGVSVYEALLVCLRNKNAPDIMNIESTFYDSLTKEKIEEYETMMVQAAAAAKECGGVCNSPFANVNLTEYSRDLRDAIYCSSEVVIAEIKHLKINVALFLELYRQRISTLTRKKLELLTEAAKLLDGGTLNRYFRENEEEFYAFSMPTSGWTSAWTLISEVLRNWWISARSTRNWAPGWMREKPITTGTRPLRRWQRNSQKLPCRR